MLDNFDLLNMPARRNVNEGGNGRAYDPLVGRFLSPDPFVQNPSTRAYGDFKFLPMENFQTHFKKTI